MLTLTGTGGVGKTRLALVIAARMHDVFADGVRFVSLAVLREASLVLPTIVQGLGLPEKNRPPLSVLQAELREQSVDQVAGADGTRACQLAYCFTMGGGATDK